MVESPLYTFWRRNRGSKVWDNPILGVSEFDYSEIHYLILCSPLKLRGRARRVEHVQITWNDGAHNSQGILPELSLGQLCDSHDIRFSFSKTDKKNYGKRLKYYGSHGSQTEESEDL